MMDRDDVDVLEQFLARRAHAAFRQQGRGILRVNLAEPALEYNAALAHDGSAQAHRAVVLVAGYDPETEAVLEVDAGDGQSRLWIVDIDQQH
jgi:hypothetical protein